MMSCGMYDHAGDWLYTVGLPAKSGVAGGIIAVLPGELGIGVFSPRLDEAGNSYRGVKVCEDMSQELELHSIQTAHRPPPPVRSAFDLSEAHSKRIRLEPQRVALERVGTAAAGFELQGELTFAQFEQVAREVLDRDVKYAAIDFERVTRIDDQSASMLTDLAIEIAMRGGALVVSSTYGQNEMFDEYCSTVARFPELDLALEWCEDQLLLSEEQEAEPERMDLEHHTLFLGCTEEELVQLRLLMPTMEVAAGERAFAKFSGPADEMLLVMRGRLSAYLTITPTITRRVTTVGPGSTIGEVAFINREERAGTFVADTDVECALFTRDMLRQLLDSDPALQAKILGNMLRIVARQVGDIRSAAIASVQ
jgi:glutaminase